MDTIGTDFEDDKKKNIKSSVVVVFNSSTGTKNVMKEELIDEQKLIEASAHDEDLRTLVQRPAVRAETICDNKNESNITLLSDDRSQPSEGESQQSQSKGSEVPKNVRDLYKKNIENIVKQITNRVWV